MQGEPKKDYLKELKKRTIWRRIVACLAVVVAVSTGYALILPAVTMEQQAVSESKKETEADWEATLPDALTGEWGTDLAAVAQSQIGYTESSTDTAVNDAGEVCGYTRYGAWYGDEYGDWNGMFLAFCLHYAEIPEDAVKASADVSEMLKAAQEKGFYKEAGQYEPEAGDIAFLPDTQAGIVTEVSPEGVSVTAGDINGTVAVIEKAEPLGYGSMETAAALYTGNEAERQPENEEGQSPSEQDGTAAGSDGNQPTDGGADSEVQADQTNGLDSGGTSQPAGDTGEEQAGGENEAAEQAGKSPSLKEYVNQRGFGNEAAAFEENLIDANGQTIEPDDEGIYHIYEGEAYRWSINLYAPAGLPEAGTYEYPLPENIKAEGISVQEIRADDGTPIGTLEVSEDKTKVLVHIVDNKKIRVRVYFEIYLDIQLTEEGIPANQHFKFDDETEATVEKSGEINSEGKLEWTITVHIPKWDGQENYSSYYLWDILAGESSATDLSKAEISITQEGEKRKLNSVSEAGQSEDVAWYWDEENNRLYLVSRQSSHENCSGSQSSPSGLPSGWCTDWCQKTESIITITYIDEKNSIENGNSTLYNTVQINNDEPVIATVTIPDMIKKTDIDKQTGEFTITVNPGLIDLSAQTDITVCDSMGSHLFYQGGSMSITATDEAGIEQVLTYGSDYSLEVSQDLHHLKINILYPGKYIYTITYKVYVMTGGNKDVDYTNTATLNVFGGFTVESSGYGFDSSAEEYVISIRKTEQESQEVVAGAEYGLYGSNGELMATGTTDGSGEFTFVGDPAHGFILASGQLYYIQETKAPEGYYLSDTRYWFYYDDSEENVDYDNYIKDQLSAAELEGLYRETDQLIENVLNHGYTNEEIVTGSDYADPIEVQDQLIWYELPETGSTGTRMYTIAGLLLTGSAVTALYREKCKKRRNNKK